ncbi:MAG TPA: hypothetical protein VFZ34_19735, partial [Blastocatellia bacterium]|nr:hypothetical protein [Blastocatellia bacterium]
AASMINAVRKAKPPAAKGRYMRSIYVSSTMSPSIAIDPAVGETKAGKVEYRVDKTGVIHVGVGKVSFPNDKLLDNSKALIDAVIRAKPATAKGRYVKKINVASTMGPGVLVDAGSVGA